MSLNGWLLNQYLLEAPLQCRVLFKILAILVKRRRADTMQFASGERRFEHVAGIHRSFSLTRTDHVCAVRR